MALQILGVKLYLCSSMVSCMVNLTNITTLIGNQEPGSSLAQVDCGIFFNRCLFKFTVIELLKYGSCLQHIRCHNKNKQKNKQKLQDLNMKKLINLLTELINLLTSCDYEKKKIKYTKIWGDFFFFFWCQRSCMKPFCFLFCLLYLLCSERLQISISNFSSISEGFSCVCFFPKSTFVSAAVGSLTCTDLQHTGHWFLILWKTGHLAHHLETDGGWGRLEVEGEDREGYCFI